MKFMVTLLTKDQRKILDYMIKNRGNQKEFDILLTASIVLKHYVLFDLDASIQHLEERGYVHKSDRFMRITHMGVHYKKYAWQRFLKQLLFAVIEAILAIVAGLTVAYFSVK